MVTHTAADSLLERCLFVLDADEFRNFTRALAKAPKASDLARKLGERPTPWKD